MSDWNSLKLKTQNFHNSEVSIHVFIFKEVFPENFWELIRKDKGSNILRDGPITKILKVHYKEILIQRKRLSLTDIFCQNKLISKTYYM